MRVRGAEDEYIARIELERKRGPLEEKHKRLALAEKNRLKNCTLCDVLNAGWT